MWSHKEVYESAERFPPCSQALSKPILTRLLSWTLLQPLPPQPPAEAWGATAAGAGPPSDAWSHVSPSSILSSPSRFLPRPGSTGGTAQPGAWPLTGGRGRGLPLPTRPSSQQVAAHRATTSYSPAETSPLSSSWGQGPAAPLPATLQPRTKVPLVYLFIFGAAAWPGSEPVPCSSRSLFAGLPNTPYPSPRPPHLPLSTLPQVLKIKLRMKPNTTLEHCPANALHGHRILVTDHKKKGVRAECPYMGRG